MSIDNFNRKQNKTHLNNNSELKTFDLVKHVCLAVLLLKQNNKHRPKVKQHYDFIHFKKNFTIKKIIYFTFSKFSP